MVGDPVSILLPFSILVALVLVVLGLGVPGKPEVLVPLVSAPPIDAFIDGGSIELLGRSAAAQWALRGVLALVRAAAFGFIAAVAIERARGAQPRLDKAWARIVRRLRTLVALAGISSAFAWLLLERSSVDTAREAGTVGTGLLVATLFLPGAFVASLADDLTLGRALGRAALWVRRRPIGHLVLGTLYVAALNGLVRLATFGEPGTPPAFPLALYAFLAALLTATFAVAHARRYSLLYSTQASGPGVPARRLRQALRRWRTLGAESRATRRVIRAESRAARRSERASLRRRRAEARAERRAARAAGAKERGARAPRGGTAGEREALEATQARVVQEGARSRRAASKRPSRRRRGHPAASRARQRRQVGRKSR